MVQKGGIASIYTGLLYLYYEPAVIYNHTVSMASHMAEWLGNVLS